MADIPSFFYSVALRMYYLGISSASLFIPKASKWIKGRKEQKEKVRSLANVSERRIWFHCSSLGEFEQGLPVLESIRNEYPGHKIVLTFFSPSGYEHKKNTSLADYVFYMPLDGANASKNFLDNIRPELAFFVKYEFWYFYGKELQKRKIPFFCLSAVFRPGQIFFKPWGDFFRKMLLRYTHLFVQDQESLELLYKHRVARVTVSGDTRFDRVYSKLIEEPKFTEFLTFADGHPVIVCGSTWPADESVLLKWYQMNSNFRMIIAPHEVTDAHCRKLATEFDPSAMLYSEWKNFPTAECKVIIIDSVGMLSSLYRYGKFAYIGGGFGAGIHNILEAVVFGIPVYFGPNFKKFLEAKELIKRHGAFCIRNEKDLDQMINMLTGQPVLYEQVETINKKYIAEKKGATEVIMNYLRINHPSQ